MGPRLEELIGQVKHHPNITIHYQSIVTGVSGVVGNFHTTLSRHQVIDHGIVVLAIGAEPHRPVGEYLYGQKFNVAPVISTQGFFTLKDFHIRFLGKDAGRPDSDKLAASPKDFRFSLYHSKDNCSFIEYSFAGIFDVIDFYITISTNSHPSEVVPFLNQAGINCQVIGALRAPPEKISSLPLSQVSLSPFSSSTPWAAV